MEEEAKRRKERLAKLKQKTLANRKNDDDNEEKPVLRFRNFEPTSELLIQKSNLNSTEENTNEGNDSEVKISKKRESEGILNAKTVEEEVKGITDKIIQEQKIKMEEEVNLTNLAPSKPNWDLKKDIMKKLNKLENQTQLKIHQIVRDRIKSNNNSKQSNTSLLEAINTQVQLDQKESEQEED
ncbi:hypothetical protein K502DRAFT_341995, partial [Neoconidiobolus thromboides FSU 785]